MSLKSMEKRVKTLESTRKPEQEQGPPLDWEIVTYRENEYLGEWMTLMRKKATELGYGTFGPGSSNYGDPMINEAIMQECIDALNEEEQKIHNTLCKIQEKAIRLTGKLSPEEKELIQRYNDVAFYRRVSLKVKPFDACRRDLPEEHSQEELDKLRTEYITLMQKHGEPTFEGGDKE